MRKILLAISLVSSIGGAHAHDLPCLPYEVAEKGLVRSFNERVHERGLANHSQGSIMVEIWKNVHSRTFTILLVRTDGIACFIVTGTDLEMIYEPSY